MNGFRLQENFWENSGVCKNPKVKKLKKEKAGTDGEPEEATPEEVNAATEEKPMETPVEATEDEGDEAKDDK